MWLQSKIKQKLELNSLTRVFKMSVRCYLCSLLCILVLMLAGCASTEDIGVVQWEIEKLRSDVKDIKNRTQTSSAPAPSKPADEDRAGRTAI
ncbi:MAG: hypothetical protein AABZ36_08260, partial [Nitrospirota bacterium]